MTINNLLLRYIFQKRTFAIPDIQAEFNLPYLKIKNFLTILEQEEIISYQKDLTFQVLSLNPKSSLNKEIKKILATIKEIANFLKEEHLYQDITCLFNVMKEENKENVALEDLNYYLIINNIKEAYLQNPYQMEILELNQLVEKELLFEIKRIQSGIISYHLPTIKAKMIDDTISYLFKN